MAMLLHFYTGFLRWDISGVGGGGGLPGESSKVALHSLINAKKNQWNSHSCCHPSSLVLCRGVSIYTRMCGTEPVPTDPNKDWTLIPLLRDWRGKKAGEGARKGWGGWGLLHSSSLAGFGSSESKSVRDVRTRMMRLLTSRRAQHKFTPPSPAAIDTKSQSAKVEEVGFECCSCPPVGIQTTD